MCVCVCVCVCVCLPPLILILFYTLSVSHGLFQHNRKEYGCLNIRYRAINVPVIIQTFITHCLAVVNALKTQR